MIDATNATCVHTLSRNVADRLNAYFSCIQNSSSVRLHLTSRFRLSIESTRLVAFTIYVDFFSPPFSSHCFFSYLPCKRKAVKNGCEVILKSTCSRIFSANSTLAGFPLFHALAIIYILIPLEIKKTMVDIFAGNYFSLKKLCM